MFNFLSRNLDFLIILKVFFLSQINFDFIYGMINSYSLCIYLARVIGFPRVVGFHHRIFQNIRT